MTNDEFERVIDAYFAQCEADGTFPDEAGMICALGLMREQFDRLLAESGRRSRLLHNARLRRESLLTRELYATDKAATGKIFLARQPSAGSMSDKPQVAEPRLSVEVHIAGETDAFG